MSSARSTSDGRGPVTRKEFRIGRNQGNLARTSDVAVVICLKLVFGPCGSHHYSAITQHKHKHNTYSSPFTQSPYPPRSSSLVRDEQTHPHRSRLVVSHSTCPPLSSPGIRSPICLVVGSRTSHPGVLGSIPKREEPGKTGAPCVKVPGSSRVPCVMCRLIHTGLGSSSLIAHVLLSPPPPTRTAL